MSSGRLTGKIALITGSANKISETIALRYLVEGATVVIAGRDEQNLHSYRDHLVSEGGVLSEHVVTAVLTSADVRQRRLFRSEVIERLERVDILVNIVESTGIRKRLPEVTATSANAHAANTLDEEVGNLLGVTWSMIRTVVPKMLPGGSIINVSPLLSWEDPGGLVSSMVPNAVLDALSIGLARELEPRGIRVNTLYPGPVDDEADDGEMAAVTTPSSVVEGVARTAVFLGSDDSAGLNGQQLVGTRRSVVPAESRTTFVSRPGLRTVDATGKLVLVCAGDQVEDALALTGVMRSCGAEVVLGFRSRSAISEVEQVLQETRRLQGPSYTPPPLVYLNPLEPENIATVLDMMHEQFGMLDAAIVLPVRGLKHTFPPLAEADDETITQFLEQEIVGAIALASFLARFWERSGLPKTPRVIFMSNSDDGRGNVYASILRAGVEQLVRVWRHESSHEAAVAAPSDAQHIVAEGKQRSPIWSNQIVRYLNKESESLEFACAWAAKLLNGDRRIDEINLYLPEQIVKTTGAKRPSFGWAESLFGLHLGKVALITGGSAGIGGQIGRLLALSGASVMLAARGAGQLEQLRERILRELYEIGYTNVEARVQIMADIDVASEDQLKRLVEHTLDTFGRIDYLINNAGIAGVEEMVIDMPLDGWNRTLQANLISNFSLIRKLAPLMKAQGSGYILNVSSYFGGEKYVAVPYPNRSDYAVSKAGQRAMVEAFARFMGPEIQINALAPGPVDGDRLRGTGERPGLFMRRARLILENKRLNEVHAAIIESHRDTGYPIIDMLKVLMSNGVQALGYATQLPEPLHRLAVNIWEQSDPQGSSRAYLLNGSIAEKLVRRLEVGGLLDPGDSEVVLANLPEPPVPFFTRTQIEREARKVRDGIIGMLYLQRMPTEFDVALATVYYLADRNVSGETFHPSGGLKFERTVTEGELFGKAGQHRLEKLRGMTVYLIGEYLRRHLLLLARTYLEEYDVGRVVLLTETAETARELLAELPEHRDSGRLCAVATEGDLETAIDRVRREYGSPGPVVCTPFRPLPTRPIVGGIDGDWSGVLDENDFAELIEHNLTHHFRVAQKVSLMDGAQLVLVTPETSARSTAEEFALANFVKTTLHAFTATAGVESERTVHRVPVNQVDLTRRARNEEPRNATEEEEELKRFVDAVLLTTAPLPEPEDSRYRARIYRGNAITV